MFLEIVLLKSVLKKISFLVNWHNSIFLYQSKQQMVPNALRFLLSSLIANMTMILINFQQKFALVRNFQRFAIKFLSRKRFLIR